MKNKFLTLISLLLSSGLVYGYDVETHKKISEEAVKGGLCDNN